MKLRVEFRSELIKIEQKAHLFQNREKVPVKYETVKECKTIMREALKRCDGNPLAERALSAELGSLLARRQANQPQEYYYLWLGSGILLHSPPEDPAILLGLIARVEAYRNNSTKGEVEGEMAVMCIELLTQFTGSAVVVKTMDARIDWEAWNLLKHEIEKHRGSARLNGDKTHYVWD